MQFKGPLVLSFLFIFFSDVYPGHDDAIAILIAGYQRNATLHGISTVFGNQTLAKTSINASCFVKHIKKTTNIFPGAQYPLVRELRICPEIHGDTGLDCDVAFESAVELVQPDNSAIHAIKDSIETCYRNGSPLTLIATGALTNIALLLSTYPHTYEMLHGIYIMGGAIGIGNTHPSSEFNIMIDPESAKIVFDFPLKHQLQSRLHIVPLEVTHTNLFTRELRNSLELIYKEKSNSIALTVIKLMSYFEKSYREVFGFDLAPVHDPCAVMAALEHIRGIQDSFTFVECHCEIETEGRSAGRTNFDMFNYLKKPKNCYVATKMKVSIFSDYLLEAINAIAV